MDQYIKYNNGLFCLVQQNMPDAVKVNKQLQSKILNLVVNKFSNYNWTGKTPSQKLEELNLYVFDLIKDY
jgi:hypothetical protein